MAQGQKKRRHSNIRDVNDQVNDLLRQAIRTRAAAVRIAAQAQRARSTVNDCANGTTSKPSDSEDSQDDGPLSQRTTDRSNNTSNNANISISTPSSNASAMAFAMSTPEPIISLVTECLATMKSVLDLTDRCVTDLVMLNIRELVQQKEDLQRHGEWLMQEMRRQGEGHGGSDDGMGGGERL